MISLTRLEIVLLYSLGNPHVLHNPMCFVSCEVVTQLGNRRYGMKPR